MIYRDIATVLVGAGLPHLSSPINQVFIYSMPDEVPTGVLITPVPGTFFVSDDLPGYFKGEFLVVARSPSLIKAQEIADAIVPGLDRHELPGTQGRHIKRLKATTLPHAFPRSEGDLFEFLVQGFIVFTAT